MILPLPIEFITVLVSKAALRQFAYLSKTVLLEYLISSLGILSGPVALPFFNASAAALTSYVVTGCVRGDKVSANVAIGWTVLLEVNVQNVRTPHVPL